MPSISFLRGLYSRRLADWEAILVKATAANFVFGMILLFGCGGPPPPPPPASDPEVATVIVKTQSVVLTTELPGRVSAYLVAEIRPQVNGLIQERFFTEGAYIQEGQDLYQIDPAPFQAALENAEANLAAMRKAADRARAGLEASIANTARQEAVLELAQTNADRYQELFKKDAITTVQRDQVVTEVKVAEATLHAAEAQEESDRQAVAVADAAIQQAEAAVETAKINLSYTKITSPISGRIGRSNITEGAIATAYQPLPLATIQQVDPIYVDVPQSTLELIRWKRNLAEGLLKDDGTDKVKILLEDGTVYPQEGVFQFRDVTVDPTTGSVIVRIVVPNPEGTLLPGMFVRVIAREGIKEQAILVPQPAVLRDHKGDPITYIVDSEGKVEQRSLTLGRAIKDQWLVLEGLTPGDHVIVEGTQRIQPGEPAKEVPFEPGSKENEKSDPGSQPGPKSN